MELTKIETARILGTKPTSRQDAYNIGRRLGDILLELIPDLDFNQIFDNTFMAVIPDMLGEYTDEGNMTRKELITIMTPFLQASAEIVSEDVSVLMVLAILDVCNLKNPSAELQACLDELLSEVNTHMDMDCTEFQVAYWNAASTSTEV